MIEFKDMKVRCRIAPSPTGDLHVGGLRTALYNFAWAKKHGGQFILRIEDTDRERLVPQALERLLETFKDFGLVWDEGPFIQSERLEIYKKYALKLIEIGAAYYCFCPKERLEQLRQKQLADGQPPRYDRCCRNVLAKEALERVKTGEPHVIRLKVPDDQTIVFNDLARGEIKTNSSALDDQVLLKSDGFPTYHLAVVIDDHLMKITHIIRANEWISSTPKHVLLYQAFGWEVPEIIHLSVFLDPAGEGKMSKRKGSVSARAFLEEGYLPAAVLNYLMLLGWNPGTEQEIFSLEEFIRTFDLNQVNISNQKFTREKLDWFNREYLKKLSLAELTEKLTKFSSRGPEEIAKILPLVRDRLTTLADFDKLTTYFFSRPEKPLFSAIADFRCYVDPEIVINHAVGILEKNFSGKILEERVRKYCAENDLKVGDYFMALRVAVTGQTATPPLWDIMQVLGKEETLDRLKLVTRT